MNINFLLVNFFFILGLTVVFASWSRRQRVFTLLGLCAAAAADTASAANGLVAWPVFAIAFHHQLRWRLGTSLLGVIGGLVTVAYLVGLSPPEPQMDPFVATARPFGILQFMAHYFGAPWKIGPANLANGTGIGAVITAVVAMRFLYRFVRGQFMSPLMVFMVAIVLFALGTGFLTALGRLNLGLAEARSGRYFIGTEVMQFAVLTLLVTWLIEKFPKAQLVQSSAILLLVLGALMLPEQVREIAHAVDDHRKLQDARTRLLVDPGDPEALSVIYPDVDVSRRIVGLMSDKRIYGFGLGSKGLAPQH